MKWKMTLVLSIITVLLIACNSAFNKTDREQSSNQEPHIKDVKGNALAEDSSISETNIIDSDKKVKDGTYKNYEIEGVTYNEKEVSISYPSIKGLSDTVKQNKINEILKDEANVVFNDFYERVADTLSLKINYEISWANNNLLSVKYYGHAFDNGAAYPIDLLYTINIDMNKGCKIMLKDYIKIDEDFINKYMSYKVVDSEENQMKASAFKYILDTYSEDDLLQYFNNADMSYKESAFTFSYLTNDSVGISIEVPHAMGDHIEIELKYEDIKDNIKIDQEIWKGLIMDFD